MGIVNFKSFCKLSRIEHAFMLALAAVIAQIIALGTASLDSRLMLLSIIPPFFIGAASFILNDYFDVEADKANKRLERPLVNGTVKKQEALAASIILFIVGVIASWFVNFTAFEIAVVFAVLAVAYNYKLKELPLIGNVYIASSMAIALVYGNYVVSQTLSSSILFITLIAFLVGLAREITKTVQDMEGDRKARKARTLPFIIGTKNSLAFSLSLYALSILLSLAVFFYIPPFAYNLAYLAPVLATDLLIAHSAALPIKKQTQKNFEKARKYSLYALFSGLVSFLLGAVIAWRL